MDVDVGPYYQNCMFDSCMGKSTGRLTDAQYCDSTQEFLMACIDQFGFHNESEALNVLPFKWRDLPEYQGRCKKTCPGGLTFKEIRDVCEVTSCQSIKYWNGHGIPGCTDLGLPGCECMQNDYATDYEGICQPKEMCPCFFQGRELAHGSFFEKGCQDCYCQQGIVTCSDERCADGLCDASKGLKLEMS